MFFIQACRGTLKVKPSLYADAYETGHHNDVDTIEIWGSPPNEAAFRDPRGSVLFQFVCAELEENYKHLSLQKMMQNWSRKMNDYQGPVTYPSNAQRLINLCTVSQGQLNKELFFVPNPDELVLKKFDQTVEITL